MLIRLQKSVRPSVTSSTCLRIITLGVYGSSGPYVELLGTRYG